MYQKVDSQFAHSHLTSKNIFVNLSDMHVLIGDFGLFALKKFCKIFHGYNMVNNWSAPEIWESHYMPKQNDDEDMEPNPKYDQQASFFNRPSVDIYSYGFLLWELETNQIPFEQESMDEVYNLLVGAKVRPKINLETNKQLALLIRRCWQDNAEKRPGLSKIMDSLKIVEFSGK